MPNEEQSLGEVAVTQNVAGAAASPFGTPNPAPGEAGGAPPIEIPTVSIIDTILQLDDYLSGDVRRAEKTARFCSKPWLEADIDELLFELDSLTDAQGNPLQGMEQEAYAKAAEVQAKQAAYGAAFVSVRMAQLTSDDWQAFKTTWREVLDKPGEKSNDFYNALIEVSAKNPTINAAQAAGLRKQLGDPQIHELEKAAWEVNTNSGVSIPKSPLSSHVLRHMVRAQS